MSARRFLVAATIVIAAGLCAVPAAAPGVNAADVICIVSPFALLAALAPLIGRPGRRRTHKTPAGSVASPSVSAPIAPFPAGSSMEGNR